MEFQFGDWLVSPEANIVSNGEAKTQLEPRVMAVLRYLCRHPGAVIPAEEILQACWGSNELGDNPVHKAITQLRRAFGDSTTEPRYIETIRKRGYRAIAPIVTFAAPPSTTWEGGSPFRGLEAFQENHAAIFFGRVQATAQLRDLVMTQAAHGCPMALVLGPSGSGKTSLVRAGLLPHLMAGATRSDEPIGLVSTVYLDCADLGSGTLFQALAGALIDADINGEPLFPGVQSFTDNEVFIGWTKHPRPLPPSCANAAATARQSAYLSTASKPSSAPSPARPTASSEQSKRFRGQTAY